MSDDCIFCQIIDGQIPSYTVHEGEDVYAFLDANPLAEGHTLVVPKTHQPRVGSLSAEAGDALFSAVRRLTPAVKAATDADGVTVAINDGEAAGQEIPHVHAHLVPRTDGDTAGAIHSLPWPRPEVADEEFEAVADAISAEH